MCFGQNFISTAAIYRESFFAVKNSTVIVPRSGHHSYDRLCTSGKEQVSKHVDRHICQKIMSSTEDNVVPSAQQNDLEHDEIEEEDPVFDDHSDDYTRKHEGSASESLRKASESKGDNPAHAIRKRLSRMAMHNYLEAVLSVLELFDRIHVVSASIILSLQLHSLFIGVYRYLDCDALNSVLRSVCDKITSRKYQGS